LWTANQKRIRNAKAALRAYGGLRRYSDIAETDITDLVTDLYHLAQSENVDVEVIARQALTHFKAELVADTEQEPADKPTWPTATIPDEAELC
jgi:hypothetical protein